MRRILLISACLGVLVFAGATTALARGPHHRPPAVHYGHGHHGYGHGHHGVSWYNTYYHGGHGPYWASHRRVVAYPAYPLYGAPIHTPYPQLGFGIGGRNFSFWVHR